MARRLYVLKHPRDYLAPGGAWPTGPFTGKLPPEARLARALAKRLDDARGKKSRREVARLAKVDPQTVINVLDGRTWGDLVTIARLERGLETQLWGDEHRKDRSPRPRDYLTPDGVWPDGPLKRKAPREAHLALAVAQRFNAAGGADEIDHLNLPRVSRADVENFVNGNTWGDLRMIASLERVVASPLWGYEHLLIRQPLDGLDTGETWPDGRLRANAPEEAHSFKTLAARLQHACRSYSPEYLAQRAHVAVLGVLEILEGTGWSDYSTLWRITRILDQLTGRPAPHHPDGSPGIDTPTQTSERTTETNSREHETYPLPAQRPEDGIDPNDIPFYLLPSTPSRRAPQERWKQKPGHP